MASATVTPDASVGAGGAASSSAVSSTPSAGGAGAATGSETALLTDDQILGIEQGGNESSTTAATTAETTTAAPAAPEVLSIDDFKALFPNNPKVQSLWDKYSSSQAIVGKFGTAAEAHNIADTVRMLGGPEKLASIAQTVADIDQTDARFFNGSPEDRKSLVSEWYEGEGPQDLAVTSKAVYGMVEAALDVMSQRDQNGFLSLRDDLAVQCLRSAPSFQKLLADAAQSQDPAAKAFVQWAQHFGMDAGQNGRQLSPEAQRLAKERESFGKQRTDPGHHRRQDSVFGQRKTHVQSCVSRSGAEREGARHERGRTGTHRSYEPIYRTCSAGNHLAGDVRVDQGHSGAAKRSGASGASGGNTC